MVDAFKRAGIVLAKGVGKGTMTVFDRNVQLAHLIATNPLLAIKQEVIDPYVNAGVALGKAVVACGKTAHWVATHSSSESAAKAAAKITNLSNKIAGLANYVGAHPEEAIIETFAFATDILLTQGTTKLHRYLNNTPIITRLKEEHKLAVAAGAIGKAGDGKGAVEAGKNIIEPNKRVFNAAAQQVSKGVNSAQSVKIISETSASIDKGIEQILDRVKSFEQARNKALSLLGDLGPNSRPYIGRIGTGKGNIVGRQSADRKFRWRLDYDPNKGPHINVEDFRAGKGMSGGIKKVIPFEGDKNTVESLLKHLNR